MWKCSPFVTYKWSHDIESHTGGVTLAESGHEWAAGEPMPPVS